MNTVSPPTKGISQEEMLLAAGYLTSNDYQKIIANMIRRESQQEIDYNMIFDRYTVWVKRWKDLNSVTTDLRKEILELNQTITDLRQDVKILRTHCPEEVTPS